MKTDSSRFLQVKVDNTHDKYQDGERTIESMVHSKL